MSKSAIARSVGRASCAATIACLVLLGGCDSDGTSTRGEQTADTREPSVARLWNEALLQAIRTDLARPTVHARNLFHISAAMYDAWAISSDKASTYLEGK